MIKNKFNLYIIYILIFINILLIIKFYNYNYKIKNSINSVYKSSNEYSAIYDNLLFSIKNNGQTIGNISFQDSLGETKNIDSLFYNNKKKYLICRISDSYCSSCSTKAVECFLNSISNYSKENIAFFLDSQIFRIFKMQINYYKLNGYKVYNVHRFNINAEFLNFPYYFILDSNKTINFTYIPNKETPNLDSFFIKKMFDNVIDTTQIINKCIYTKHSFGRFPFSDTMKTQFVLKNDSLVEMKIDTIFTSCECTSASANKSIININDSAIISVTFKTDKPEEFSREVYVKTNSGEKPIVYIIDGQSY